MFPALENADLVSFETSKDHKGTVVEKDLVTRVPMRPGMTDLFGLGGSGSSLGLGSGPVLLQGPGREWEGD